MRHEKAIFLFVGWLFLIFCFFPYVSLLGLNTSTQPNALFFSIFLIFLIKPNRLPKELILFGIVLGFATLILLVSDLSFLSFRDWANYLSLVLITFGAYNFLCYINGLPYKFFYSVVGIWLLVGIIQMFVNPTFLSFLFHQARGALFDGRGVTGLSPEPTYYGLMLGLFFIVYLINKWYERSRFLGFLILFQMFYLSRSATVMAFFVLALGIFLFILMLRFNLKSIASFSAFFIIIAAFLILTADYYKELRIYQVSEIILEHPERLLATDYSVSERVNHILFPIVGMFENKFLPHGFGKFGKYLTEQKDSGRYNIFFLHHFFRPSNRILSGHGKVFFELGGIGLLISIGLFSAFKFGLSTPPFLFGFIFYFVLLFAALPFMTATVPFVLGNCLFLKNLDKNSSSKEAKEQP